MAEPEQTTAEPTSPFWARMKIIMGFAPALVALGTAITAIVKVYDQSSQKAVYETLSKKVEENSASIQDTHSDVKAVWAYLNGMAVGKAATVESASPPPVTAPTSPPLVATPVRPKVNSFLAMAKKFETPATAPSSQVDQDRVPDEVEEPAPRVQFDVAQVAPRKALPEMSPAPKVERLPSFEDVIERPKSKN